MHWTEIPITNSMSTALLQWPNFGHEAPPTDVPRCLAILKLRSKGATGTRDFYKTYRKIRTLRLNTTRTGHKLSGPEGGQTYAIFKRCPVLKVVAVNDHGSNALTRTPHGLHFQAIQ